MGSINGKEIDNHTTITSTIPPSAEKIKQRKMEYISPLHRSSAFENRDPRSPGGIRRSPIHTPLNKAYRERVLMRLGSPAQFRSADPRSPASQRTPIQNMTLPFEHLTPPPFSLGGSVDPRSPYTARTPLYISTPLSLSSPEAVIMDDVVVVEEKIIRESGEAMEKPVVASEAKVEKIDVVVVESSGVMESTAGNAFRESFSSSSETSISPALMALSISPLGSPAFGMRKRKSIVDRYPSLSPLKKSYSAPSSDENTPPSVLKHSAPATSTNNKQQHQIRTPLSPLVNKRCMDVQPIKFRMDPGVLGL